MLKYLQGVESIKMGDPGANGAMGSTLTEITSLVVDSVQIDKPEGNPLFQYIEGTGNPVVSVAGRRDPTRIIFATKDYSADNQALFFGGTATLEVYDAPVEESSIYQSIEIVTKTNDGTKVTFEYPYVMVNARGNGQLKDSESGAIEANCIVLSPTDASGAFLSPEKNTRA